MTAKHQTPISRRDRLQGMKKTTAGLLAIGLVGSFLFSFLRVVSHGGLPALVQSAEKAGPTPTSRSALGHRAAVETLRRCGFDVAVDRVGRKTTKRTRVIVEPRITDEDSEEILRLALDRSDPVVLFLPKRWGTADPEKPWRIDADFMLDTFEAQRVIDFLEIDAEVVRPVASGRWSSKLDDPAVPEIDNVQLVRSPDLTPLVSRDDGILIGVTTDDAYPTVYLVSDPDFLANHDLGRSENAALLVALMAEATGGRSYDLIFDDTVHVRNAPSFMRELTRPPLVLLTLHLVLLLALAIWSGFGRIGHADEPAPIIAPGKTFLIANTAELLARQKRTPVVVRRYVDGLVDDLAERLHVPANLAREERLRVLRERAQARGIEDDPVDLVAQATASVKSNGPREVTRRLQRLHQFREEMLHGSGSDS